MTRIVNILVIAILGTTFTGCSLFSKNSTITGDKGEYTESASKTRPNKQKPAVSEGDVTTSVDATVGKSTLGRLEGEWIIVKAGKVEVNEDPDDMPYVYFENKTGRFYASNGCNILNGDFESTGNDMMKFSNVLSTMQSCPDTKYRNSINAVLCDGVKVKMKFYNEGSESYVELLSTGNSKLMVLRKHNMESLNGKWIVTKIGDVRISDPEVNIFLDIPEHKVHGNTGCNYFNGTLMIDPAIARSITFQDMAVTMRACPNQETEMALLVALEQTHSYKKAGNTLTLCNDSGKELIELKRE